MSYRLNKDGRGLESTEFDFGNQKRELVRMTGSFKVSETSKAAMELQEQYLFTPQVIFLKARQTMVGWLKPKALLRS